jgi:hypothetical protein
LSPVVEPVRDPRGDAPGIIRRGSFLISEIGGGFVRGLMGYDPTYLKAVPCGKHYFANTVSSTVMSAVLKWTTGT